MKNSHHRDFRSLSETAQAEVRRQAFRNFDYGMDRGKIAILAEVHIKTIGDWLRRRKEFEERDCRGQKKEERPTSKNCSNRKKKRR